MELRLWAQQILSSPYLEDKLFAPDVITDHHPGTAFYWDEPARAPEFRLQWRTKEHKLPSFATIAKQEAIDARTTCLHRFAGHELLAVEMLCFAVLAWPCAPKPYRRSLIHHIKEEQQHTRLYKEELDRRGVPFGSQPLFRHFWAHLSSCYTLQNFISTLNLTLEQANLDFCPIYAHLFSLAGDDNGAQIMAQILKDEVDHVKLGLHWSKKIQGTPLSWEHYTKSLPTTLSPDRCSGFELYIPPREKAGVPYDWIDALIEAGKNPQKRLPPGLKKWIPNLASLDL